jgi:D-glycero-D-manno-heptose 1,7-bisphosphate phosphatase
VTVPTPAVLFDRDGTLVVNSRTTSIPRRSSRCLPRSRRRGCCDRKIPMAVVGNQSVVGRGWASIDDVAAANARVEIVAGRDRAVLHLLARPRRARRACRKPQPGLVPQAADALGLDPADMVVIADRLSDFQAER